MRTGKILYGWLCQIDQKYFMYECSLGSRPDLPRSVRVLIVRRRQTFECRLRTIKTRTEQGRPGTEAILEYSCKAELYLCITNVVCYIAVEAKKWPRAQWFCSHCRYCSRAGWLQRAGTDATRHWALSMSAWCPVLWDESTNE